MNLQLILTILSFIKYIPGLINLGIAIAKDFETYKESQSSLLQHPDNAPILAMNYANKKLLNPIRPIEEAKPIPVATPLPQAAEVVLKKETCDESEAKQDAIINSPEFQNILNPPPSNGSHY
jgi:hypothetical protein